MKHDCYLFDLYQERLSKRHTLLIFYPPHTLTHISKKKPGFEMQMFVLMSSLFFTYSYVPDKDRMNKNQASYFVSTRNFVIIKMRPDFFKFLLTVIKTQVKTKHLQSFTTEN